MVTYFWPVRKVSRSVQNLSANENGSSDDGLRMEMKTGIIEFASPTGLPQLRLHCKMEKALNDVPQTQEVSVVIGTSTDRVRGRRYCNFHDVCSKFRGDVFCNAVMDIAPLPLFLFEDMRSSSLLIKETVTIRSLFRIINFSASILNLIRLQRPCSTSLLDLLSSA